MNRKQAKSYTINFNECEQTKIDKLAIELNTTKSKILLVGLYMDIDDLKRMLGIVEKNRKDNRQNKITLSSEEKEILQAIRSKKLSIKDIKTL